MSFLVSIKEHFLEQYSIETYLVYITSELHAAGMTLPNSYWLKGEAVYKRREKLKTKYTFDDYKFSREYINDFIHWFFVTNIPRQKSAGQEEINFEAALLLNAVFHKGYKYDKALDRFCDVIKLDKMAWRASMYRKAPGKPGGIELEYDMRYGMKPARNSSRPYGSRWSKRLAGVPAELIMNEGCFGASK